MGVTGVLLIVWAFSLYQAGENRGASGNSWSRYWAIGSWFIPLANLILPKLVLNEAERMTALPVDRAPIEEEWKSARTSWFGAWWWLFLLALLVVIPAGNIITGDYLFNVDRYGTGLLVSTAGVSLLTVSLFLGALYSYRVGKRAAPTN